MNYDSNKHHRRSIRLQQQDYSTNGLYFITICTFDKSSLFGQIKNETMCLNELGSIIHQTWNETSVIRSNVRLGAFVVMPNHIHGIIEILPSKYHEQEKHIGQFISPSHTLGAIIRGFKGSATRKIRQFIKEHSQLCELYLSKEREKLISLGQSIWQRNYYESIIRDEKSYGNRSAYIDNNPIDWHKDKLNINP